MVSKLKTIIAYHSYSGNTKEIAKHLEKNLKDKQAEVIMHRIGVDSPIQRDTFDILLLGTFTWEYGEVPDEVKDFIIEVGYKPENVAIFGSGDTQFGGDDIFCLAVDKLAKFYNSPWSGLKIEQSPRGVQEEKIDNWMKEVIKDGKINSSKNIGANISK